MAGSEAWDAYEALERGGQLPLRVFLTPLDDDPGRPAAGRRSGELLSCDRLKIFSDGSPLQHKVWTDGAFQARERRDEPVWNELPVS